jgi:hypothetical protein
MMFQEYFGMLKIILNNFFFFQTSFFIIKCASFLLKIEKKIKIIYKKKALEIGEIHLKTQLNNLNEK